MVSLRSCLREMADWDFSPDYLVEKYLKWVSVAFYVFLKRERFVPDWRIKGLKSNYVEEYAVFRSRKRGDENYARHVKRRFYALGNMTSDETFFSLRDRGNVRSPVLFATLEYDANRYKLNECWERVGDDFNRWKSYIRRKFGKFASVRVWEAHESGYPHIHVALAFEEKVFFGGFMANRQDKGKFRVKGEDYSVLRGSWRHGFSDFVLCNSVKGAFKYAGKYLMKGISVKEAGSKAVTGLAMCWVFRKRSFSLSGDLAKLYADEITLHSKSNKVKFGYKRLDGGSVFLMVTKWEVWGFMESKTVRWLDFQKLSNNEVGDIMRARERTLWTQKTLRFKEKLLPAPKTARNPNQKERLLKYFL